MHSLETIVRLNDEAAEKELACRAFREASKERREWRSIETEQRRIGTQSKRVDRALIALAFLAMGIASFLALALRAHV